MLGESTNALGDFLGIGGFVNEYLGVLACLGKQFRCIVITCYYNAPGLLLVLFNLH